MFTYRFIRFFRIAAILLFLPLLLACSAQKEDPLRIGTNIWPGYESFYIASQFGLYGDSDIKIVAYSSAIEVMRAYRNREIEGAALTMDEVLNLADNGQNPKVVLITDSSNGADMLLGQPDIEKLSDINLPKSFLTCLFVGTLYRLAKSLI